MEQDALAYFMRRTEQDFKDVKEHLREQDTRVALKFDEVFKELKQARAFEIRVMAIVGLITVILAPTVTLLTLFLRHS